MTTSKLPEWPEECRAPNYLDAEWRYYNEELSDAALARMEALVEYAVHRPACLLMNNDSNRFTCRCGLSELLAACERKEAGR